MMSLIMFQQSSVLLKFCSPGHNSDWLVKQLTLLNESKTLFWNGIDFI